MTATTVCCEQVTQHPFTTLHQRDRIRQHPIVAPTVATPNPANHRVFSATTAKKLELSDKREAIFPQKSPHPHGREATSREPPCLCPPRDERNSPSPTNAKHFFRESHHHEDQSPPRGPVDHGTTQHRRHHRPLHTPQLHTATTPHHSVQHNIPNQPRQFLRRTVRTQFGASRSGNADHQRRRTPPQTSSIPKIRE